MTKRAARVIVKALGEITMLKAERQQAIQQQLHRERIVRVAQLSSTLQVDPVTIRRDLAELEAQGVLRRVHGGGVLRESGLTAAPEAGGRSAQIAAGFIPQHSVIFLGPGTLTVEMIPFLHQHEHLTIITNALDIAWYSAQHRRHTLHLLGGQVYPDGAAYGDTDALQRMQVDWVILQAQGLDAARGLTHGDRTYAELARQLFRLTAQVMILAEPQVLEHTEALFIAPASDIDILVTGRAASNALLWDLSELGVRIMLA